MARGPVQQTPQILDRVGNLVDRRAKTGEQPLAAVDSSRDLIARRHSDRAAITVNSTETVMAAYRRMKLYDVSQVPVMQDGRIIGIVDEEDILHGECDLAFGSRALDRGLIGVHQSWRREQGGRIFNLAVRLATGLPFWDTQCGFKAFTTEAAQIVFSRQPGRVS